jgi:hypothetical protein
VRRFLGEMDQRESVPQDYHHRRSRYEDE